MIVEIFDYLKGKIALKDPKQEPSQSILREQLVGFLDKAASRPSKDDPMGMVQLGATLVAAQLTSLLLQGEQERKKGKDETGNNTRTV